MTITDCWINSSCWFFHVCKLKVNGNKILKTRKLNCFTLTDTQYLKNWRPVTLLNVDYKIATKTIVLRIEKVLPHLINPTQTGYVKGRFIGESIRLILDIMEYTKHKDIPGVAVFLDFEKAFDSV